MRALLSLFFLTFASHLAFRLFLVLSPFFFLVFYREKLIVHCADDLEIVLIRHVPRQICQLTLPIQVNVNNGNRRHTKSASRCAVAYFVVTADKLFFKHANGGIVIVDFIKLFGGGTVVVVVRVVWVLVDKVFFVKFNFAL